MKAIIEIARKGDVFDAALGDLAAGGNPDYILSFESARTLFFEVSPARLDLLESLRQVGPCSIRTLATATGRNYSNVHGDIDKLIELNLVERLPDGTVHVPFDAVEIHMALVRAA